MKYLYGNSERKNITALADHLLNTLSVFSTLFISTSKYFKRAKGTVIVTLIYQEETATIKFPTVKLHNSELDLLFEEVRHTFGFSPGLNQREWEILQARWMDMPEVVDHDEADEESNADDLKL